VIWRHFHAARSYSFLRVWPLKLNEPYKGQASSPLCLIISFLFVFRVPHLFWMERVSEDFFRMGIFFFRRRSPESRVQGPGSRVQSPFTIFASRRIQGAKAKLIMVCKQIHEPVL